MAAVRLASSRALPVIEEVMPRRRLIAAKAAP
jgi:hypothetical protein